VKSATFLAMAHANVGSTTGITIILEMETPMAIARVSVTG